MADPNQQGKGEVLEAPDQEVQKPPQFKVILHNDDYTPMEFVVEILGSIFQMSPARAHRIMMNVHLHGSGLAGVYPYEVAETKVALVHGQARDAGYPLRASIEEE